MVAPILDHMTALADPTRCRMLMMLEKQELTVSELCAVLQMPQSTVSRHLKTLSDDDWVTSRRDGTSRFYTMPVDDLDSGAKRRNTAAPSSPTLGSLSAGSRRVSITAAASCSNTRATRATTVCAGCSLPPGQRRQRGSGRGRIWA